MSCIVQEMSREHVCKVTEELQTVPYSISTDGSHTSDSKLYPIIVTYPDKDTKTIKLQVLSVPALDSPSSTGQNIGHLVLSELDRLNIPLSNCTAMGSDNAPVMLGEKSGVISVLRERQPEMIALGCPCHLINIAAQNAAKKLPVSVDSLLIDLFYYMEGSVNRKQRLKEYQVECGEEVRKILKHVVTRWLPLGQCLPRILSQWDTITKFIDAEVERENEQQKMKPQLQGYKIPKKTGEPTASASGIFERKKGQAPTKKKEKPNGGKVTQPTVKQTTAKPSAEAKQTTKPKPLETKRILKIQQLLHSNPCRAYANFLLFTIKKFERMNVSLQKNEPMIHELKSVLTSFLRDLLSCFLKPAALVECDPLYVDYRNVDLHKEDVDISIGNATLDLVEGLEGEDLVLFFESVKEYYFAACDYVVANFHLKSDVLKHAEVATVSMRKTVSFSSVRFFIKKLPILLLLKEDSKDSALDGLQEEFNVYQTEHFDETFLSLPLSCQWFRIGEMKDALGALKFSRLSFFMLGLLTIPHSNSECERVFSQVRKNKTDFRGAVE